MKPCSVYGWRRLLLCSAVLALLPAIGAATDLSERQLKLMSSSCIQCHARPETGAPLMGNPDHWRERVARGPDALLRSVILGTPGMPPGGYCMACDTSDFRALIQQMTGLGAAP